MNGFDPAPPNRHASVEMLERVRTRHRRGRVEQGGVSAISKAAFDCIRVMLPRPTSSHSPRVRFALFHIIYPLRTFGKKMPGIFFGTFFC